jgi:hypothetical protein
VTSGVRRSPIAACTLPHALVRTRLVAIAATSLARQLPITHATTRTTAHALLLSDN